MTLKSLAWCFLNSTNTFRVLNPEFWSSRLAEVWWLQVEFLGWFISVYLCCLKTELWGNGCEKLVIINYRRVNILVSKTPTVQARGVPSLVTNHLDEKAKFIWLFHKSKPVFVFVSCFLMKTSRVNVCATNVCENTTQTVTNINIIGQSYEEWKINLTANKPRGEKQGREGEGERGGEGEKGTR